MLQVSKSIAQIVVFSALLYGCGADPEVTTLKEKLESLATERDTLLQANDALTKERDQLTETLNGVKTELASATDRTKEMSDKLNEMDAARGPSEEKIKTSEQQNQGEIAALNDQLAASSAQGANSTEQSNAVPAKGGESQQQPESLFIDKGWQIHTAPDGSVYLFPPSSVGGN